VSTDILPSPSEMDAPSRRPFPLRWVVSAVVVVLVLALVAGITVAVRGLSGGGSQPEDALPSGAFAFAKVDLDPSAGQKINAIRFLRKFPALRDKIGLDADLRESLFEGIADGAGWDDLRFDQDVAPWLGQRIGVAAYGPSESPSGDGEPGELSPDGPGAPAPLMVVALQVTDAGKARAGLARLNDTTSAPSRAGIVVQDGYALIAEDQATADRAAKDATRGVLADDDTFRSDLGALGDGVASAWVNMDGMTSLAGGLTGLAGFGVFGFGGLNPGTASGAGRTSYVLRFDGADALEVRGAATGATSLVAPERALHGFTDLPDDSVVAFGLAGGDRLVPGFFDSLRAMFSAEGAAGNEGPEGGFDGMVADAERELGIELPDDLAVLLGSNFVGAMRDDETGQTKLELGARVTTDGPRAVAVLDTIYQATGAAREDFPTVHRLTDDGVVIATSEGQADLLSEDGGLGDRDAVRKALPDIDDATVALWVDIRSLMRGFMGTDAVDENLEPIEGLGMTARISDDGAASYRLRLVTR
jgi:hypothetical protein